MLFTVAKHVCFYTHQRVVLDFWFFTLSTSPQHLLFGNSAWYVKIWWAQSCQFPGEITVPRSFDFFGFVTFCVAAFAQLSRGRPWVQGCIDGSNSGKMSFSKINCLKYVRFPFRMVGHPRIEIQDSYQINAPWVFARANRGVRACEGGLRRSQAALWQTAKHPDCAFQQLALCCNRLQTRNSTGALMHTYLQRPQGPQGP